MNEARARLAAELRRLRELSGRSLKDLEVETHASDSSLSRYLSGRTMPPWSVVAGLCRAAGREPDDLRPIWTAAGKDPITKVVESAAATAAYSAVTAPTDSTEAAKGAATVARSGRVRWRQAVVFFTVGAIFGIAALQAPRIVHAAGRPSIGTRGPHFSVTLLEPARPQGTAAIWSFNARCGNADEYRLVYDLPISVQHRATAYRVDHADCTLKLFDGVGGSGIGEPLANDQKLHPVPPALARRGSSLVAYSCCNGSVLVHRP